LYNSKKKGNGPNKLIKRCDEQAWIKNMYFFAARMLFKEKIWRANECLTSNTIALPARMIFGYNNYHAAQSTPVMHDGWSIENAIALH